MSVPRSQPESLSHRVTTAPMNDLQVETVVVTNPGGVYGEDSFGTIQVGRPDEDH